MATYHHDGLILSYDDSPVGERPINGDLSFKVMLQPVNPSNIVTLWYRIDGGPMQSLHAMEQYTDYRDNTQCFRATFPRLGKGQSVAYGVAGNCAGRQVPDPTASDGLPHSFVMVDSRNVAAPETAKVPERQLPGKNREHYDLNGEFLARFTIHIEPPRVVGPTPDGIRVTWNAKSGSVEGPKLVASVLQGADWVTIRTDGIAHLDVRALLETPDGVKIMTTYVGLAELGEDGYQNFLSKNWPQSFPAWTTPLFWTADSRYKWLNRLQCVSVGEVFLADPTYVYTVYALR